MSAELGYRFRLIPADPFSAHWSDGRIISAMRLMLVASALLLSYIDPSQPGWFVAVTSGALVLYTIYSAVLCIRSLRQSRIPPLRFTHWIDMALYIPLITLSTGPKSVFFFFFAVLTVSFGWGFTSALRLTLVTTVLFTSVVYATAFLEPEFEMNGLMLRCICLLVLGYMISFWGGFGLKLKKQLRVLKEISSLSNPRFGIERTINSVMESFRSSYDADTCLLINPTGSDGDWSYELHRVHRGNRTPASSSQKITEEMARLFLFPSTRQGVIYNRTRPVKALLYDIDTRQASQGLPANNQRLINTFDGKSFVSVPVRNRNQAIGRLYIVGSPHKFDYSDIEFALQLIEHVNPILENIRLVDHLASDAAEQERQKIALDIHDSVIQPYIGLQFGLAAIRQQVETGSTNVLKDVNELMDLTNNEIAELRRYMRGLRSGEGRQNILLPALQRFAFKFSVATGINVELNTNCEVPVKDRLAAEVFQIVAEGLSNIRRHTRSGHAWIDLSCDDGALLLLIKNDHIRADRNGADLKPDNRNGENGHKKMSFMPRSIAERAALLGGEMQVYTDENKDTVLSIRIPLHL